jgi:O-antigen ligase
MLACLLTMAVPFAIVGAIREPRPRLRAFWIGSSLFMVAAVLLTFSHALGGFLAAMLIAAWPLLRNVRLWRRAAVAAVVAVVIVSNLSVVASIRQLTLGDTPPVVADTTDYFHAIDEGRLRIGPVRIVYEVMSYFRIKELAWQAFRRRPLTGVGLDQFHEVSERAYRDGRLPARYRAIDPHSSMLGRLAETGLPGGLTLALLWIGLVVTGLRAMRDPDAWPARAALAGLAGLLIAGINIDVMNFRFFWAALGLLRGVAPESSRRPPTTTTP